MIVDVNDIVFDLSLKAIGKACYFANNKYECLNDELENKHNQLEKQKQIISKKIDKANNSKREEEIKLAHTESDIRHLNDKLFDARQRLHNLQNMPPSDSLNEYERKQEQCKFNTQIEGLEDYINEIKKSLSVLYDNLQTIEDNIDILEKYLLELNDAMSLSDDANKLLHEAKESASGVFNTYFCNLEYASSKIEALGNIIYNFNDGNLPLYLSEKPYLKKLQFAEHNLSVSPSISVSSSIARTNQVENKSKKTFISPRLKFIEPDCYQICEAYKTLSDFENDIKKIECNDKLKIKIFFKTYLPFFDNINLLTDYLNKFNFYPKLTSSKKIYKDINNYIYFSRG